MIDVGDGILHIRADMEQVKSGLSELQNTVGTKGAAMAGAVGGAVAAATSKLLDMAQSAGSAIAGFVADSIKELWSYSDSIVEMSERTGIGTGALQELGFMARQSGGDLGTLERAIRQMQQSIDDELQLTAKAQEKVIAAEYDYAQAAQSTTDTLNKKAAALEKARAEASGASSEFGRLGLSLESLKAMKPDQQFLAVAEALAKVKDPTERAAIAMDILGARGGTAAISIALHLDELRATYKRLGIEVDDLTLNKMGAQGDAWIALKEQWDTVKFALAVTFIPLLDTFIETMQSVIGAVRGWIKEHPTLTKWIAIIVIAIGGLLAALAAIIPIVTAVAAIIASTFVAAIAAWSAVVVGAIALIGGAITALVVYWDELATACSVAWDWIVKAVTWAYNTITYILGELLYSIYSALIWPVELVAKAWDWLWDKLAWVGNKIAAMWDWLGEKASALWNWIGKVGAASAEMNANMGMGGMGVYAAGGVIKTGMAIVGEQGPELLIGAQGARVYSATDTANMVGGTTINAPITINNPVVRSDNDIREIARQVSHAIFAGTRNEMRLAGVRG